MDKNPFIFDMDYFDEIPQGPYVFKYKKQDLKIISIRLGDVRDEMMRLLRMSKDNRHSTSFKVLVGKEMRMESAINEIIREDFKPKLNY